MSSRGVHRWVVGVALAVFGGVVSASGCEQILAFEERRTPPHVASCSGGVCTCSVGFDECDGDVTNGCEDLSTPENCGACGHDCLGGTCSTAGCTPLTLHLDPLLNHTGPVASRGLAFVLEHETHKVFALEPSTQELRDHGVFDGVPRAFKGTPEGAFLLTLPESELTANVGPFHGKVFKIDESGVSEALSFQFPTRFPQDVAVTPSAWWLILRNQADSGFPELWRIDRASGKRELFTNENDFWVESVGADVFWAFNDDLYQFTDGGMPTLVDSTVTGENFWVGSATSLFAPLTQGGLVRLARDTSSRTDLPSVDLIGIDPDGDAATWLDPINGKVMRWDGVASSATVLADDFQFQQFGDDLFFAAHDDVAFYWLDQSGISRLRRP